MAFKPNTIKGRETPRHSQNKHYKVNAAALLMEFLMQVLQGQSRTTIKSLLGHKMILVNGKPVTQFNYQLQVGNVVEVLKKGATETVKKNELPIEIVFEDQWLVVVNKPSGLLTVATETEKQMTAYRWVSDYLKMQNTNQKVFVLHRLDRDTSGLVMFAKSQQIQTKLQSNWDDDIVNREYIAVVEGKIKSNEGTLTNWLVEGKTGFVHVGKQEGVGKKAITHYKVIKYSDLYTLLNLKLETGRKNQIRVQLSNWGYPVAGDKKYGAKTSPLKRLALHALTLAFVHPVTGTEMKFKADMPPKFASIVKNK